MISILIRINSYKLYPYRWVVCIFFCTQMIAFGIWSSGFVAITPLMSKVYHVNINYVAALSVIYSAVFLPVNLVANKLAKTYGIALPIKISCVLGIIGSFARLLVPYSFHFLFAGQAINSIGMPFINALGANVAGAWFSDNERGLVTTLCSIGAAFGSIFGIASPAFFVSDKHLEDYANARDRVWTYILFQSICTAVLCLPNLLLAKSFPRTPPSASAEHNIMVHRDKSEEMKEHKSYMNDLKKVMVNWNYWRLNFCQTFVHSMFLTLGTSVSIMLEPFSFNSNDISFFGAAYLITGILFSIIHGVILDKFKKFKLQTIFI